MKHSNRRTNRGVLHMLNDIESRLAEERRAAAERAEVARASLRKVDAVRLTDGNRPTFAVTITRGDDVNIYTITKRSPSAWRLARLVGDEGRPLFNGGYIAPKASKAPTVARS